jgi:myo-inositol-1-phosphate synthase
MNLHLFHCKYIILCGSIHKNYIIYGIVRNKFKAQSELLEIAIARNSIENTKVDTASTSNVSKSIDAKTKEHDNDSDSDMEEHVGKSLHQACRTIPDTTDDYGTDMVAQDDAPFHRWDDLDGEVQLLDEVVQRLRHRDQARNRANSDDSLPVKDYPTAQDPDLYRVRVQVGSFK